MLRKTLAALTAAVIMVTAFAVPPADAAKKAKRYRAQSPPTSTSPSLDGRVLGRTRTCWFDTLQYDGFGVPYGPYCH
jgi:hypothetical protein